LKYDLLEEPWIPIMKFNEERKSVGILELFKNANEMAGIDADNAMNEYGIIRFLDTFLMAAFLPKNVEDIQNILEEEIFDMKVINSYIETCKREGVSFDIFDKTKPFLQAKPDVRWDNESDIKSVANLDYTLPSGNNAVHFNHTFETDVSVKPDRAAVLLLSAQTFCTAGVQGYPSNVNGAPPMFFIPQGRNLFETLVYSMIPVPEAECAGKNELWRNNIEIEPLRQITKVPLLSGMFFPARRIRLIEEKGMVRRTYLQQGMNYIGYDAWTDPHVAYRFSDKGRSSFKPSLDRELWRDIGTISDHFEQQAPEVVKQYQFILSDKGENVIPFWIFGVVTSNASYLNVQRGNIKLDKRITTSFEKNASVSRAVQSAEEVEKIMFKALRALCDDQYDFRKNEIQVLAHQYYQKMGDYFFGIFSKQLAESKTNEQEQQVCDEWEKKTKDVSIMLFESYCSVVCNSSKWYIRAEKARYQMNKMLYKPQKEVKTIG